jgi:hypothetical protein
MEHNCNRENLHLGTTDEKRNAAEVMLTFSTLSPEKVKGVPGQRDCARVLGIPYSTLAKREKALIEKC